jgi:hypothetical protein
MGNNPPLKHEEEVATPEVPRQDGPKTARRHRGTIFQSVQEDDSIFHRRSRSMTLPTKFLKPGGKVCSYIS